MTFTESDSRQFLSARRDYNSTIAAYWAFSLRGNGARLCATGSLQVWSHLRVCLSEAARYATAKCFYGALTQISPTTIDVRSNARCAITLK